MNKMYLPLNAVIAYILFTLLVAIWGPIDYIGLEPWWVSGYILAFLLFFSFGYRRGIRKGRACYSGSRRVSEKRILRIVKLSILLVLSYKSVEFIILVASGGLSFSNIGENYLDAYSGYIRGEGSFNLDILLRVIFQLPQYISLILGLWYFRKLSTRYKAGLAAFIFLTVIVNTIGQGKQKQLGDIVIFTLSIVLLNAVQKYHASGKRLNVGINRSTVAIASVIFVAFLSFTSILGSRSMAIGVDASNIGERAHPLMKYQEQHPIFQLLGDRMGLGTAMLSSYFSQGYLGLSLAFNEPFVWTYGVGNSYSTTVLLEKGFGLPLTPEDSYPYRVGARTDWGQTKWHTIFSWLASDFTFPGVLVFFYFFALIYGRCWRESVIYRNPISILFFSLLNLAIAFIPANNQLLHSPEGTFSVFLIFMFWLFKRRRMDPARPII